MCDEMLHLVHAALWYRSIGLKWVTIKNWGSGIMASQKNAQLPKPNMPLMNRY